MNVKLSVLSAAVLFFMGHGVVAQKVKKDTTSSKLIDEVVVVGYRSTTKKTAVTSIATVDNKTIENRPNSNVLNIIQGQLAGVNVTASTGQPGAKPTVIIRGVGTYNGNTDPLYVIDGFPSNSDNFRSINPNDIETFSVLKDASAIAEYGSRGANGVIMITTKRGNYSEKTSVRYSTQFGVSMLQDPKYNYVNSRELLTMQKRFGAGWGAKMTDEEIANYNINTNWRKVFFRPAVTQSHDFSIESGGKNINSYTSVGYLNQDGILKTTGLKRFTVRNNINGKSSNNRLKYSLVTGVGFSKNNEAILTAGAINRNYILGAYQSAPYVSPDLYQNGKQLFDLYQKDGTLLYTPLMLMDKLVNYNNSTEEIRLDIASNLSYKITNDLTARVRTSGQYLDTKFTQAEYPLSFNAFLFKGAQEFSGLEDVNKRREFLFNNLWQLEYSKTLDKHTFSFTGNLEYNYSQVDVSNMRQRGLDPKTFVPGTGSGYISDTPDNDYYVPQISVSKLKLNMISYFGLFSYDFDKKYGIEGVIRRDGTSRFANGRQWGNFWSVGGRWNIDQEAFMDNVKFVDTFKLRASYGTQGNQRIVDGTIYDGLNPPGFTNIYSVTNNSYNANQGYAINFGDGKLRWETTKQYNIGADFEFFKRRLRGSFDYYNKKTVDLYMPDPTAPVLGTLSIVRNTDASIVNKGIELSLAYDILKNKEKDISLTFRVNGSINTQKVDGIKSGNGRIPESSDPQYVTANGGLLREPFVYKYLGVNPNNGNLLFEDINGNPTENPTAADRRLYGKNNLPKYQGGFGMDFNYKNFFASTTFTFVARVVRYDYDMSSLYNPNNLRNFTVDKAMLNAWTPTNTNTDIPSLKAANLGLQSNSDRFIKDASYLRLRNVQVGYRFPQRYLKDTFINSLSVILQAENLLTISNWKGFDPESPRISDQQKYPTPRIITLGFDIKF
ncbi:SusC/RagA family TonB-linked outer membrane protein [Chryseobacterium lactis]|uniref:SusC/RagA family TonB-linked outer membrane protein n=1 Tax=Chryseobacterium lactis TaxID=1241981 RepID=A0A3G6RJQ4_CHRLC|nr:SusC/RagA family TonB-linked outer membrane protein [Chryseobacterium lactis]AZA84823.1 SusC/RagA family TonB-linked outer membrane protein [Chryseobacterium lactis]AZB05212.1 SusC/RagA family TonB-linked outer membrane protein [Chryseobacterium lactis]PNW12194.1 SusC/RagA family TonB-linked outer membrane protein [Chryseobacterium lactis]